MVPSPRPRARIFEIRPIRWLLDQGVVVICAGGGGIPTMFTAGGGAPLIGVEAVIDKDLASELLAREVDADLLVMATDVDAVYADWGTPNQRRLEQVDARQSCARMAFPAGSMGPKVDAAAASSSPPGSVPRSAVSPRSSRSSTARPAPRSSRG